MRSIRVALMGATVSVVASVPAEAQNWAAADAVEIRRTAYGVPHIKAQDLFGAGFGLGYAESEDHGQPVFEGFIRARGHWARHRGYEGVGSDMVRRRTYALAERTWRRLDPDVRHMMEGFAAGVQHYLDLHPEEAPSALEPPLRGVDVHAMQIGSYSERDVRRAIASVAEPQDSTSSSGVDAESLDLEAAFAAWDPEVGSNAWALDGTRTKGQAAMLLRNPHLNWDAGYYEAHLTVPGVLDFYGDFRIGGLFGIIGGFNANLGWTTTNNAPDLTEVYRLRKDARVPSHYLLDGVSYPLRVETVAVDVVDPQRYRSSQGRGTEVRTFRTTHVGPVVRETAREFWIVRSTEDGEFRRSEQFLAMMRAKDLEEWRAAMREQRIGASNYTYADRAGNIFYVWNAKLPSLPHPWTRDGPVLARRTEDLWNELVRFDRLPQLLNPTGGYVRNENDPPYWTNLNEPLVPGSFVENMPDPRLRFRSQLSLSLIHGGPGAPRWDLSDMVTAKHSPRMLLAERIKNDLVNAARVADATPETRSAAELLTRWDNTVSLDSRGSTLFELWFARYVATTDSTRVFRDPWSADEPTGTPRGLGNPANAVAALEWAMEEATRRWGSWDVPWGEVHRVRWGDVDVPVSGCSGALGCFRVLNFRDDDDGRRVVRGGDGWVLAVEFGEVPRAMSVLAYGQSGREDSEHFSDQAEMFARGELKPVAFTESDIASQLIRSYAPGRELVAAPGGP